jgi:predicted nucleotidyltransferase
MYSQLEENISVYFRDKKEVIAVYLFGSHAKGKARPLSDIDVGILLDKNDRDFLKQRRKDYTIELGRTLRKDIHPIILNLAGEELLKQIFSKGRCILINDARKLALYRMVMFARIADFAYYRSQMQSGFIRKVMES